MVSFVIQALTVCAAIVALFFVLLVFLSRVGLFPRFSIDRMVVDHKTNSVNTPGTRNVGSSELRSIGILRTVTSMFGESAAVNAALDKQLFDLLSQKIHDGRSEDEIYDGAKYVIYKSIQSTLDDVGRMFSELTGAHCAASLHMVVGLDAQIADARTLKMQSVFRDSASQSGRTFDHIYHVAENTMTKKIILERNSAWMANDLASMIDYTNNRMQWREYYNSVFAIGVPNLQDDTNFPFIGVLTVDSLNAQFVFEYMAPILQEFSFRLSALLYRLARIDTSHQHSEAYVPSTELAPNVISFVEAVERRKLSRAAIEAAVNPDEIMLIEKLRAKARDVLRNSA